MICNVTFRAINNLIMSLASFDVGNFLENKASNPTLNEIYVSGD